MEGWKVFWKYGRRFATRHKEKLNALTGSTPLKASLISFKTELRGIKIWKIFAPVCIIMLVSRDLTLNSAAPVGQRHFRKEQIVKAEWDARRHYLLLLCYRRDDFLAYTEKLYPVRSGQRRQTTAARTLGRPPAFAGALYGWRCLEKGPAVSLSGPEKVAGQAH
jgi:hypothetical protein